MKAHLTNGIVALFAAKDGKPCVFKLCVDRKVHLDFTDHGWGKATCKVMGPCDGTCCQQVDLVGSAADLVEKFLASDGKESGEVSGEFNDLLKHCRR